MSINQLLDSIQLPTMILASQQNLSTALLDLESELIEQLETRIGISNKIKPGMKIAITAGSRGINNLDVIIKVLVSRLRELGAIPFVFPAMGSHGGASAEGQIELLRKLGICESVITCPIISSMQTIGIGATRTGLPVYMDKNAYYSDGIIVINRIKPHTSFHGVHESGIVKMLVIGIGKQKGAEICHQLGFDAMSKNIEEMARVVLSTNKILFGVGIVENANNEICMIESVKPSNFFETDSKLLELAKNQTPVLPFNKIDVLVINEIGKEISGTGFDTNIVRYHRGKSSFITRIVVLNLSKRTGGNANGLGRADITTKKVFEKFNFEDTYPNALTSTALESVKIPAVMDNDKYAIKAGIKTSLIRDFSKIKLLMINNTSNINKFLLTETLLQEATCSLEVDEKYNNFGRQLKFDQCGNLILNDIF